MAILLSEILSVLPNLASRGILEVVLGEFDVDDCGIQGSHRFLVNVIALPVEFPARDIEQ
jgi:hypothetical protein